MEESARYLHGTSPAEQAREQLLEGGLPGAAGFDFALEALQVWSLRPGAAFRDGIFRAEGVRP